MMKNTKLMALVLATLMVLAMFASCGEQPDETTAAKVETTAKAEGTTQGATTAKVTTKVETTAPETEHTQHTWAESKTFTAYEQKDDAGNIGYLAVHCTYSKCNAIKDDKMEPVLLYCDFEADPLADANLSNAEKVIYNNTGIVFWKGNSEGKTRTDGVINLDPINGNHSWDPANQSRLLFLGSGHRCRASFGRKSL